MKRLFISIGLLSLLIMISAGHSQIIPDFQVNESVCDVNQAFCDIAMDSSGNFVITWGDGRDGGWDVYAQRFSRDGTALGKNFKVNEGESNQWSSPYYAQTPSIDADRSGNFVITWKDLNETIFAQRYSSDGIALGCNFKVNDDGYDPSISSDDNGNFVIVWSQYDTDTLNVYAQRFSHDGTALGSHFKVNDNYESAGARPHISTDGGGNFVVTWIDHADDAIHAQRFSSDGTALGSNFRVNDGDGTYYYYVSISSIRKGDFVIAFREEENGEDIYAQRYSSEGTAIGSNFRVNDDEGYACQWAPSVSSDDNGNFVITWCDERNGREEIFAQRFLTDGTKVGNNYRISDDESRAHESEPSIALDDNGNFAITWCDYRNCSNEWEDGDIYAQRFSSDGKALNGNFKVNNDVDSSAQLYSFLSVDSNGNFVITWADNRNDGFDIYAQRFSSDGAHLGNNFKVSDSTGSGWMGLPPFPMPSISADVNGNFAITWPCNSIIYTQRYLSDGTVLGSNFMVNADAEGPSISSDSNGNFIITWFYNSNIYAQRFSSDGTALGNNFQVNDINNYVNSFSSISTNSSGNFIITWEDERNGNIASDIYAQRYSGNGTALGSNFKVNDDEGNNLHWFPAVTLDVNGYFVITWTDGRNNEDIYAQRYSSDGIALGSNFKVNDEEINAGNWPPSISSDVNGNFIISWTDNRDGDMGIYAQRFNSDGTVIGNNFEITNTGAHPDIKLCNGRIYTTWYDNRCHDTGDDIWVNVLDWNNPLGIGKKDISQKPSKYKLSQNYPNPFNPKTVISLQLAVGSHVELSIYNILGQKVETLVNMPMPAGFNKVEFNGQNLPSGIYLYRIKAGEWSCVKKMILIR